MKHIIWIYMINAFQTNQKKWSSTIEKDWKLHKLMIRSRLQLIIQKYFPSIFASYYFYKSFFHNCFSYIYWVHLIS